MSDMKPLVIEGDRVLVVEPFPLREAHRIFSWMKAFKTVIQTDYSPRTKKEFVDEFKSVYNNVRSFAVIDKNNTLDNKPIEIVGSIIFEPQGRTNGFLHVASRISAFGSRVIDEAGEIVIQELFNSNPELTRLSAVTHYKNNMAASLAKRVGFVKEGKIEDMIVQKGEPKAVVWFGLTRKNWERRCQEKELCHSSEPQHPLLEQPVDYSDQLSESLESKVDKQPLELSVLLDSKLDSKPKLVETY
jgi:RimJ/RimL family protein N-acetyltransferase